MVHDLLASVSVDEGVSLPKRRPVSIFEAIGRARREIAEPHQEQRVGGAVDDLPHVVRGPGQADRTILNPFETVAAFTLRLLPDA